MESASGTPSDCVVGRPFQPGQSGNPTGRPKRRPIADLLLAELEKAAGRSDATKAEKLVERLVGIALTGKRSESVAAANLIIAYTDGLPTQRVEVDVYDTARQMALERGLDPDKVIDLYEKIKQQRGS
jgi:hypothetical protein